MLLSSWLVYFACLAPKAGVIDWRMKNDRETFCFFAPRFIHATYSAGSDTLILTARSEAGLLFMWQILAESRKK